ncbi:DUF4249 domain-containing protein [Adhaeribacter arboris]|uniref:DUF4249 domain-containing protein n=1 Tax=Adhaeribacter arboris TaxID=2072846 RepID=A0A2T2YNI2_9BACT|nr:DUF4249 family protein [Adhaeribacter arboris]PSR57070.1 DUF4249 domain-containing protein [Adhaeribacter arboris]
MKWFVYTILLVSFFGAFSSCEEDINLDIATGEEKLVVQGHIEQDAPPFVVLTRSLAVLSNTQSSSFTGSFVHGATVTVSTNSQSSTLQEKRLVDLSLDQKQLVNEFFGINLSSSPNLATEFYVYTSPDLKGALGQNYRLSITANGKVLTAATTIPHLTPVDSLWFMPHPNSKNDSLVTLWYRYQDPDTLGNNVRFFTSRNGEPFYPGYQASVLTDEFVNGRIIDFPLERGYPKSAKVDLESSGYFERGDTVQLKWAAIDYQHYQFWFTMEADRASNGNPFGFPTTVRSNINGGLGIWGGYGVSRHLVISR